MSETLQITQVAVENDPTASDSATGQSGENIVSQMLGISKEEVRSLANELGNVLGPILLAHGDKIVICQRLGGAEMTLSQAVNTIWPHSVPGAMLIEGLPSVLAEIESMLANRPVENGETEEPSEENQLDEVESETEQEDELEQNSEPAENKKEIQKKIIKTEISKDQQKTDETIPKIQERAEPRVAKISKPPAGETQKKVVVTKSSTNETKAVAEAELWQNESQKLLPSEVKGTPAAGLNGSIDKIISGDSHAQKAPITAEAGLSQPAHKRAQVVELDQRMPTSKPSQAEAKTDSVAEVLSLPAEEPPVGKQVAEPATENTDFKSAIEPDNIELVPVNNELMTNSKDTDTELAAEKIEVSDGELIPSASKYPEDSPVIFNEGQLILLEHSEQTDFAEVDDQSITASKPAEDGTHKLFVIGREFLTSQPVGEKRVDEEMSKTAEIIPNRDQAVQINLPIESMETALQQLSGFIKTSEPEVTERTNQILDKISEAPVKIDKGSEAETSEELEELFIELFETANIDYTSELIDSLVLVTLKRRLLKEIEETDGKAEIVQTPPEPGTHEIIKKLLVGLSSIKKAITHAYTIGRSALLLYRFSFADEVPLTS